MRGFRWFFCSCVELSNGPFLSKRLKRFAESKYSKPFVPLFAKVFHIDTYEARYPIMQYSSLHSFFIRELKDNQRSIDRSQRTIVSPVDGVLAEQGRLTMNESFLVKGQSYTLKHLFGSEEIAYSYEGGEYMVLYLSPSHYHRFHAPMSGHVMNRWQLGERSYPVNGWGLKFGKKPLSENYRVISEINVDQGKMAMIKVGAMNINTIELTHSTDYLLKGEEVGYFSFGSTVILIWPRDMVNLSHSNTPVPIKMGEKIASLKK